MSYYLIKIALTTGLIVAISEVAKRSSLLAAILASVPLVSVLAMIWLYIDTKDIVKVSNLATSVCWLILPSLALFVALPLLLKQGLNFYLSISVAIGLTILSYWVMLSILKYWGVRL
jgi:hypothetical protein